MKLLGQPSWENVQTRFADVPGERGIELRQRAYKPFFARFGEGVRIEERCRFYHPDRIVLDDDVRINIDALIYGSGGVRIGRHCRIGPRCFIHSANHDVGEGADAFFERGYHYERTTIGDNSLISANVSILPGALLGAATFVAAGALVTRGRYPAGARLMGAPARSRPASTPASPPQDASSIALVTPREGHFAEAALHLLSRLGLPDVTHRFDDDRPPPRVHTAVAIGPEGWTPAAHWPNVWTLASGGSVVEGPATLHAASAAGRVDHPVPRHHTHVLAPSVGGAAGDPLPAVTRTVCYYVLKRLSKQGSSAGTRPRTSTPDADRDGTRPTADLEPASREQAAPLILHTVARHIEPPNDDKMWRSFLGMPATSSVAPPGGEVAPCPQELGRTLANEVSPHIHVLAEDLRRAIAPDGEVIRAIEENPEWLICHPTLMAHLGTDVSARGAVAEAGRRLGEIPRPRWVALANRSRRTRTLAYLGLVAWLGGDDEVFDIVRSRLTSPPLLDEEASAVRSTTGSTGYCYDPALAAVLLLASVGRGPARLPTLQMIESHPVRWDGFAQDDNSLWIHRDGQRCGLIDERRRLISRSMLDNWLLVHGVPTIDPGSQLELTRENYAPLPLVLREAWVTIFRHIQHAHDRPLIRLLPWPAPYRWALSLRYDMDRPVTAYQVRTILELQRQRLNSPCAAWYEFPEPRRSGTRLPLVDRSLQELAVHGWRPDDAVAGQGVTCHSAPGSAYWAGERGVLAAEARGAAYAEMLAAQLGLPGPAWLGPAGGGGGRRSRVWLLPIHFPLEGTTSDTTLQYFDRLLDRFHELRQWGGHVIIGSHPDLNQEILDDLLDREGSDGAWCVTPAEAVDRCRRLYEPGNVRVVLDEEGALCLSTREHVADVQVVVERPGAAAKSFVAQLNTGRPRPIASLPKPADAPPADAPL